MNLIKLDNLDLHYGTQIIFDAVQLTLNRGDRLCVVGRNGVGKSTLLKVIEGQVDSDGGNCWRMPGLRMASLSQDLPDAGEMTVFDYVAGGLADLGRDLADYHRLAMQADESAMTQLAHIQTRIEAADGWSAQSRIEQVLTRLDLVAETSLKDLSGGWRRRAALARALVIEPDVLLLDEPTNHLDVLAIEWLEKHLISFGGAIIFITHDRAFLRRVANRIGELDRGQLSLYDSDYQRYLTLRAERLAEEEKHNALFDKRLAAEEVWIRQGIKARRTRNEGRVRALKALRAERAERIERQKTANMTLSSEVNSGKLVAELHNVSFAWGNKEIVKNFSCRIIRGDKIGLIGPNGVGKSTFLKLLLGELGPSSGKLQMGTKLEVAYFDQLRDQLNLEQSAVDNVAEGREFIDIAGQSRHIVSYLNDFLFTGERARTPIKALSGGERNRVLLAKLFSKSANLLIMDEPTNDLDAETLDLLEDLLIAYSGTLLLVSHDREFLDNVVTSTIAFEGGGVLKEYVGGYSDWLRQGGVWPDTRNASAAGGSAKPAEPSPPATAPKATASVRKLSYKLQRELDALPVQIETLETEIQALQAEMGTPEFYQGAAETVAARTELFQQKQAQLEQCYSRWEELEQQKEG